MKVFLTSITSNWHRQKTTMNVEQLCQDLTIMYEELGMREGTIVIKTKD